LPLKKTITYDGRKVEGYFISHHELLKGKRLEITAQQVGFVVTSRPCRCASETGAFLTEQGQSMKRKRQGRGRPRPPFLERRLINRGRGRPRPFHELALLTEEPDMIAIYPYFC